MAAAVNVHRPCDGRLNLRPLVDQVRISGRKLGPRPRRSAVPNPLGPSAGEAGAPSRWSIRVSVATHRARATIASVAALESCSSDS